MRVSVLGCVVVWMGSCLAAAATLGHLLEVTEPKAGVDEMKVQPFKDIPMRWRVKGDDGLTEENYPEHFHPYGYMDLTSPLEAAPVVEIYSPAVEVEVMNFKTHEEITIYELIDLEPNSTRNRCRDCCRPTTYDPECPILRKEEGERAGEEPEQNHAATTGTEREAFGMEVNRAGLLGTDTKPTMGRCSMGRCSHCCILNVVQMVERLKYPG